MAILKHVAGKSADYGAALDYLKYEHDEVLKKPLLDANGNWVLRRDILLEGINCEPELFDVECEMLNAQYHKNQNYDEIKTHHYLISFDPADKDECGLTGERAQAIGMEYVKTNFPGHQALVCTHMDGHNGSGNIHVHIVINSLRKLDVPQQPFMERPIDCKAGYKHHLTKDYLKHLQQSLMNILRIQNVNDNFVVTHGPCCTICRRIQNTASVRRSIRTQAVNFQRVTIVQPPCHGPAADSNAHQRTIFRYADREFMSSCRLMVAVMLLHKRVCRF